MIYLRELSEDSSFFFYQIHPALKIIKMLMLQVLLIFSPETQLRHVAVHSLGLGELQR